MTARKPESVFSDSLNKMLPVPIHREKMNNPYRGGTADFWYSGNLDDLWVEYKLLSKQPKNIYNLTTGNKPPLSALQQKWLRERYNEGRNVAVVVGTPAGIKILQHLSWEKDNDYTTLLTKREVAAWITGKIHNASLAVVNHSSKNNKLNL